MRKENSDIHLWNRDGIYGFTEKNKIRRLCALYIIVSFVHMTNFACMTSFAYIMGIAYIAGAAYMRGTACIWRFVL